MSQDNELILHITPDVKSLSSIESPTVCEECQRILPHSSAFKVHLLQCHRQTNLKSLHKKEEKLKSYHCPVENCIYHESLHSKGKCFSKAKYVKQHYLKMHAHRKYLCSKCDKCFSTQSFLNVHLNSCGLEIKCSTCWQIFSSIESLQVHLKRFQGHFSSVLDDFKRNKKSLKKSSQGISKASKLSIRDGKDPEKAQEANSQVSNLSIREPRLQRLLPKPEPTYVVAAIALSEMAHAEIKRPVMSDIGTQTEVSPGKKVHRKSSSPCRASDARARKTKQTTEMETQTRLTHLKKRIRKRMKSGNNSAHPNGNRQSSQSKCKALSPGHARKEKAPGLSFYCGNYEAGDERYANMLSTLREEFDIKPYLNSSGTQTSPRSSCVGPLSPKKYQLNFFYAKPEIQSSTNYGPIENLPSDSFSNASMACDLPKSSCQVPLHKSSSEISQPMNIIEDSASNILQETFDYSPKIPTKSDFSSQFIEDVDVNPTTLLIESAEPSSYSHPYIGQIRSSSIETQTEHDVFLSTNANGDDDDDILSSAPLQSTGGCCPSFNNNNSIETQTCEDFSDIEQYLYSTIHTQTQENETELFPELNFTDMQTQTNLEDSPSLVTTHTQTSVLGL